MTALAAVNPAAAPAAGMTLLERHAAFVAGLDCHDQAKRLRRNGAQALLRRHADLVRWMERPTVDRIAEARRLYAWPFLSWCFAIGVLRPDVELLIARSKGAHYITWARMHPDQVDRVAQTAQEMGWVPEWVDRVSVTALATVCMTRQTTLTEITLDDLAVVRADISAAVAVLPRCRASQRGLLHSLHTVCYQLGVVDSPPEHGNARHTTIEQRMASVTQPVIRDAFVRYLHTWPPPCGPGQWNPAPPASPCSAAGSVSTISASPRCASCADTTSRSSSPTTPTGPAKARSPGQAARSRSLIMPAPSATCGPGRVAGRPNPRW
jgi:hypothetical protein